MVKRTMGRRPAPGESPLPLQVHDRSIDSCVVSFGWPRNSWYSIYTSFISLFSNIGDMFHLCPLILCHVFIGLGGGLGGAVVGSVFEVRLGCCDPTHCYDASPSTPLFLYYGKPTSIRRTSSVWSELEELRSCPVGQLKGCCL